MHTSGDFSSLYIGSMPSMFVPHQSSMLLLHFSSALVSTLLHIFTKSLIYFDLRLMNLFEIPSVAHRLHIFIYCTNAKRFAIAKLTLIRLKSMDCAICIDIISMGLGLTSSDILFLDVNEWMFIISKECACLCYAAWHRPFFSRIVRANAFIRLQV